MRVRRAVLTVTICFLLFAPISSAWAAAVLAHYDVDSLVYLSDVIVRAKVGTSEQVQTRDGDCQVHEVEVLNVFKGAVRVGESFRVAGLDGYRRGPGIADAVDSTDPIKQGDVVYLFLVTPGKMGAAKYGLTNANWTVIQSGVRLQVHERVYGFGQFPSRRISAGPMRGLVAMTDVTFPGVAAMTRDSFEWRVGQAQVWLAENPNVVGAEPDPAKLDGYIRLLRDRAEVLRGEMASTDAIGEAVAAKVARMAEPKILDELRRGSTRDTSWVLGRGLQRQGGRAYLLERIADPKEPMDRRIELASILGDASDTYQRELGERNDTETDFITKLARLAVTELDTAIGERLLHGVASFSVSNTRPLSGVPAADLQNAVKVLLDPFPAASALGRYRIADTLMQCSPASYRKVLPGAGPLLTLIEPDTVRRSAEPPRPRELRLLCRFRNQLAKDGPAAQLKLVLRPTTTGAEVEVPVDSKLTGMRGSFGYSFVFAVAVPESVAAGRYQLFFRVYEGDKAIGDGLGFEVDIPAKEPSDRG